jgi:ligand-binding SRPBCC domain-containing protein
VKAARGQQKENSLPTIVVEKRISAPQSIVWNYWDQFGDIEAFNPGIKKSEIIGRQATGIGARRRCMLTDGNTIEEKLTVYDPPNRIGWELTKLLGPMKSNSVDVQLFRVSDDQTKVVITSQYKMKFGPIGFILGQLVVKNILNKAFVQMLDGLDELVAKDRAELLSSGKTI